MMAMLTAAVAFGFAAISETKFAIFAEITIGVWNSFVAFEYILRKSK